MAQLLLEDETPVSKNEKEGLYADLKRMIEEKGLLKRQPFYYITNVAVTYVLFAVALIALIFVQSTLFRLLDAVFLGFMSVQMGFVGHDAGHRQIFTKTWWNDILGLINGFFLGASFSWWMDTHNRHHGKPNQVSYDPAISYSIIAFSKEQAKKKTGFDRFMVKHQALFFFPLLTLYPLSMRVQSARYLIRENSKYRWLELASLLAYFPVYLLFLFSFLTWWQAILFATIHQSLFGFYLSSVFVPNHMGMLVLEEDADWDFLRQQVLTARNIRGNAIIDFCFGGLNYQIEHHLFPKMARNKLRKAREIVRQFLEEKSIAYYETGLVQSFREILTDLHQVSKSMQPTA